MLAAHCRQHGLRDRRSQLSRTGVECAIRGAERRGGAVEHDTEQRQQDELWRQWREQRRRDQQGRCGFGPEVPARSFTLFFSLSLPYLVSAYSKLAPLGVGTSLLGALFVRRERFAVKRIIMVTLLLATIMNAHYLPVLIEFLAEQYNLAAQEAPTIS